MDFRGIHGLQGKEPVGAVLTIGTKSADKGFPTDRDRFYVKVPDSSNDVRVNHPAFSVFNGAAAELRRIVSQCLAAGVPVFVKQMGSNPTLCSGSGWGPIRDKKGGDPAEWPAQLRVRQIPEAAA